MNSNRTIGEQASDALIAAAAKKIAATAARMHADRAFDQVLISTVGKNADERKAKARLHDECRKLDYEAWQAESAAIVAKAEADGLMIRFEEWRTNEASRRQDGKVIASMAR